MSVSGAGEAVASKDAFLTLEVCDCSGYSFSGESLLAGELKSESESMIIGDGFFCSWEPGFES